MGVRVRDKGSCRLEVPVPMIAAHAVISNDDTVRVADTVGISQLLRANGTFNPNPNPNPNIRTHIWSARVWSF